MIEVTAPPPAGHAVIHDAPIQNFGEVTAPAFGVPPTVTELATKFVTPSAPLFIWVLVAVFIGALVFPPGGSDVGAVHA
jgi:hypothetical protein